MAQQTEQIKICTGCGRLNTEPLGLNKNGDYYAACCPDNNYKLMTAVEWLEEELADKLKVIILNMDYKLMEKLFAQALAMEKEQIAKAYNSAIPFKFGEQYYNETYNK